MLETFSNKIAQHYKYSIEQIALQLEIILQIEVKLQIEIILQIEVKLQIEIILQIEVKLQMYNTIDYISSVQKNFLLPQGPTELVSAQRININE